MADKTLSQLSQAPSVGNQDLMYLVPAAGGTQYKATRSQIVNALKYPYDVFFNHQGGAAYIDCGSYSEANLTGDFTIGIWFKEVTDWGLNGSTSLYNRLFSRVGGGNGYEVYINKDSPGCNFTIQINGSNRASSSSIAFSEGQWNYVVLQNSGGTYALYCNGCNVITLQDLGNPDSNSDHLYIGNTASANSGFFGAVNDCVIFNRALSLDEISALPNTIPSSGLVQRWPLVEGSGTVVNDIGPNSRTGSLSTNCVWDNLDPAPLYLSPMVL